ncbi:MAG: type II toxin-antitoxin system Y4mF family antitoxin [Pseudomonadota bacterium]|nr:type II toxin-antitoxin system Y4mF family antitoxin [Pseudomonadota bacterium]
MIDFTNEIAVLIKLRRKQAGLTQMQLAEYAGVSKTVVFDIEHGKPTIQLDTLLKILRVLNIKLITDVSGVD